VWELFRACVDGDLENVRRLLDRDPSLARCHSAYRTPLYFAVRENQREIAALLIERGGDPWCLAVNDSLIEVACDCDHRELEEWLGSSPLHEFARRGDVDNAAIIMRHGADLHARDVDVCSTPLAHAAKFGRIAMVEFLLRQGARVRLPDDSPWATPLAWAERRGHANVAGVLRHHAQWGVLPLRRTLDHFETLVADGAEAYATGSGEAIHRLQAALQLDRTPSREQLRDQIRRRIPRLNASEELSPADAQEWVAGMEGFPSWCDLEAHVVELTRENQRVAVWKAMDQAVVKADADALERLVAQNAEWLTKRPKGAYPACGSDLDFARGARALLVREHQFESWEALEAHRLARLDPSTATAVFEDAVDAVVNGNLETLRRLLTSHRELIQARSSRTHQATLLHYVGANGVEGFRQQTPPNAAEIAEELLRAGAEVDAVAAVYGGSTTLGLAATSVHPWLAGVQLDLLKTLLAHGASINHPQGAGNRQTSIVGCLANGRQMAAEFLAAQGATLDLEAAAGVGRLDRVREYVDDRGRLRDGATEAQLRSGFNWACEYGRMEVVGYLLKRGTDVTRLHRGQTGLHWASYGGHPELVRFLLENGAPVDVADEAYGTTPLGWALYGWFQPPAGGVLHRYPEVVAQLVGRGAVVRPEWVRDVRVRTDHRMLRALG